MISVSDEGIQYLKLIIIGSIPLPVWIIIHNIVSDSLRTVNSIALMTILFALLLYYVDRKNIGENYNLKSQFFTIIFIGFMQTFAIIPGISRSGIVITAALMNYSRTDSDCILVIVPAIFMATVYQASKLYRSEH